MKTLKHGNKIGMISLAFLALSACAGGTGTTTTGTGGTSTDDCESGDNDFYVVENASCAVDAGLLSRVNPDDGCKDTILSGLDCPIDFVMSADGLTGYLSLHTNNSVGGNEDEQPGDIYAVDVLDKSKVLMNDTFNRSFVRPSGLAVMEDLTQDERDAYCGGNTITQTIMIVADTGEDTGDAGTSDAGTVWLWCVNTDDYDESLTPMALFSLGADQMENPRGAAILNRQTVLVSAQSSDDSQGLILSKDMDSTSQAEVLTDIFSSNIQDIALDDNGDLLVADSGDDTLSLIDLALGERSLISDLADPVDAIPFGTNDEGSDFYLVSQYSGDNVLGSSFIDDGTSATDMTDGLELDTPMGLSR